MWKICLIRIRSTLILTGDRDNIFMLPKQFDQSSVSVKSKLV